MYSLIPVMGQLSSSDEVFSNTIEFSTSNYSTVLSGAKTNFSALTTYHGNVYFVYCDELRRPIIGKINNNGTIETSYLDKDLVDPYYVHNDSHHVFSIGVDKKGYIHVVGDNHANLFEKIPELINSRFRGAPYLHWVSELPEEIQAFEFIGLDASRRIPGSGFSYVSFHNDMNGTLFTQYRSRMYDGVLLPGINGWSMAKYNVDQKSWKALGEIPEATNAEPVYPAVIWEQSGTYDAANPNNSFYQGYMSDLNFDFNNRMHIAATINADVTNVVDTHVVYAYSDDLGETFKKMSDGSVQQLPIGVSDEDPQGTIVESIENEDFDGIYRNASVVFDMNGMPAVSYLTLKDRTKINTDDRDHFRYWKPTEKVWSDLLLSPQESQAGSEHFLDCNGVITFAGSRTWNAQMYRTNGFSETGYTTFALPNEFKVVNVSGVDERAIREENIIRWMIDDGESLKIVSSKFEPINLQPITGGWEADKIGNITSSAGVYNNVLQLKSSGKGLLSDGSLEGQFVNKTLEGNGGVAVRIINVDYSLEAFGGLMLSANEMGTENFYAITIDYKGLKALSNEGNGANTHFIDTTINEPSEWLRIEREGDTLNSFHSNDGENWVLFDSKEIMLPNTVNVGVISGSGTAETGVTRVDNLTLLRADQILSRQDYMLNKEVYMYPNPVSSIVNLHFPDVNQVGDIFIYDFLGNKINNCFKNIIGVNTMSIDVSGLASGVYYVRSSGGFLGRFIKI